MKYLSLFSGIGGFELGIEQAYAALQRSRDQSPEQGSEHPEGREAWSAWRRATCIGYSEIDKYAISIYKRHFPKHENYGDIAQIDPATLPDFDLVCGGFPCQAFSIAGKRRGFEDTRGTLFFEICRLAEAKRPRLLLLENVKGLFSHDRGRTFYTIIRALDELGYDCQWQLLNGADWVPQSRERVFIVGHLRGTPRPEVFPLRRSHSADRPQSGREEQELATALTAHHARHSPDDTYIFQRPRGNNKGGIIKGIAPTVSAHDYPNNNLVNAIRRLTPLECERLMGLPDEWTKYGVNEAGETVEISDTQRYKVCGNGVIPAVVANVVLPLL